MKNDSGASFSLQRRLQTANVRRILACSSTERWTRAEAFAELLRRYPQNSARDQIRKNQLSQTRRQQSPIIRRSKPHQLPDFRLRPSFALQLCAIQFDPHNFSHVPRRRMRVYASKLRRHSPNVAQLLAQLSRQTFERRFSRLALPARQYQKRCPAFLPAQQHFSIADQQEPDLVDHCKIGSFK